jgi:tetratricopeptide (TPR) repeat protein
MANTPIVPSVKQQEELSELDVQLSLSPTNVTKLLRRSEIYFSVQDYDSAIADLDAIIQIDPLHVGARINRANAYALRNEFGKSIDEATYVLGLNHANVRDHAQAYYLRGRTYAESRRFADALADLDAAIQRVPSLLPGLIWRSKVLLQLNRFDDCIRDCSRILELQPHDASTLWRRAACLRKLGKLAEALKDLDKAIAANPLLERGYVERALLRKNDGKFESALPDVDRAIELRVKANAKPGARVYDIGPLQVLREEILSALSAK